MNDIVYYDRYQKKDCVEQVYGERYLRWVYETSPGAVALHTLIKRGCFSRWYGWRMDRKESRAKIAPFIAQYGLDPAEFARQPDEFENFNAFFARALKPDARPINQDSSAVVFPADGRHLCVPDLSRCDGLFVKGQMFDLGALLGDAHLADEYSSGSLLLSRLCPVDYHRFHFPVGGRIGPVRLINGPLYSVNPIALWQNIHILATNRRTISILETDSVGRVLLIEVGATCVGSIHQTVEDGATVSKGDEKGYFRFGGSSTITIFEPGRIQFDDDLLSQSANHRELYSRMGDRMGMIR